MADPKLIHSPLSRFVERDGARVEIAIYRLEQDQEWVLEIIAANGTSTVWDDRFVTDRLALDFAITTIEAEGAASFSEPGQTLH